MSARPLAQALASLLLAAVAHAQSSSPAAAPGGDDDPFNPDGTARVPAGPGPVADAATPGAPLASSPASARPPAAPPPLPVPYVEPALSGFGLFVEQDFFLGELFPGRNEDRNYTMGVGLEASGRFVTAARLHLPLRAADRLLGVDALHAALAQDFGQLGSGQRPFLETHVLRFGVTAFTPDALSEVAVVRDDRPYASLMFLSVARTTVNPARRRWLTSELTLGILGLGLTRAVQTWIHEQMRADPTDPFGDPAEPRGWHHQISHGGEPTLKYTLAVRQVASASRAHDLTLLGEGSVGYYTGAAAGATLRLGLVSTEPWTFNASPMTVGNQAASSDGDDAVVASARRRPGGFEAFAFAGWRARLVLYNALMQGQLRRSSHTLSTAELERVVHEAEAGIAVGCAPWRLTWVVLAGRSPEHRAGANRPHFWGGIYLTVFKG